MSSLTHFDALATHVTRFSGDSSDDLSTFLLILSAIAVAASGVGLIVLCARALLRRGTPATQPWGAEALASATLHTRKYAEVEAKASVVKPEIEPELQPLSGPAPVTVPLPKLAPVAPDAEQPPSIGFGPSSTEPTVEMDMRAFASYTSAEDDGSPSSCPPSERTEVGEAILLVSKKRAPLQSFEIPPPALPATSDDEPAPITVRRSGTLPKVNPAFMTTLSSFNDSARRA
jgi:hypothetical protein